MGKKATWGIGGLLLLALTLPSLSQPTSSIRYVNNADLTCQSHNPCYGDIVEAITAVLPGETIRTQPGSYQEQLTLSRLNSTPTATEADRIVIEGDPAASPGSVVLRCTSSICTHGYAIYAIPGKG